MLSPLEFQTWLNSAGGRQIIIGPKLGPPAPDTQFAPNGEPVNRVPAVRTLTWPEAGRQPNGTCEHYYPMAVTRVQRPGGFGTMINISNAQENAKNGVYVPDIENQCTWVNATTKSEGIVMSGQFSGCTFVKCQVEDQVYIGHVYVKRELQGNDPSAQARAFERAIGAQPNSAVGFETIGQVGGGAGGGFVIGTSGGGGWTWTWLTMNNALKAVAEARRLTPASFGPAHP